MVFGHPGVLGQVVPRVVEEEQWPGPAPALLQGQAVVERLVLVLLARAWPATKTAVVSGKCQMFNRTLF